jgi:sulfite reductase beta subunit-like hemoprotein
MLNRPNVHSRLNNHHGVTVFAGDPGGVLEIISRESGLHNLTGGPDIVSCPGTAFCPRALVNTYVCEQHIRAGVQKNETPPIRISGCPNGCAHSGVAPIGLIGRKGKTQNGQQTEGFTVSTGGGMGRRPGICTNIASFVPSGDVVQKIKELNQELS